MDKKLGYMNLGKNGLTENFISDLKENFKKNKNIKIGVLKNARKEGKKSVEKYRKEILSELGKNFRAKTIGFTIAIKKIKG